MEARVYSVDEVVVDGVMAVDDAPPVMTVSARGQVNSSGWTNSRLIPWIYILEPADGVLDLDFIAAAPSGVVTFGFEKITGGIILAIPAWLVGVRVHSASNVREAMLDRPVEHTQPMGDGMPLPWPFPWLAPPSSR